ncbi:hypothetical protein CALCODRAFT_450405, partial [Calocera cornea HHB12733]
MTDLATFAIDLRKACETLEKLVNASSIDPASSGETPAGDHVQVPLDPLNRASGSHTDMRFQGADIESEINWLNPEPDKSEHAEIWRTYVKEADSHDERLLKKWNDGIDVFLLFTGLFSAILSAFLVVAWTALQPDSSEGEFEALVSISQQLVLLSSGTPMDASVAYQPRTFNAPWWAVAVNCLWFTSLFVSLSTAVLAMLIKEWLTAYNEGITMIPLERVQQRQMRYDGMKRWSLPAIVGFLPLAIHVAVFLFLLGLVLFAWPVSLLLCILMSVLLAVGLGLYTSSALLSIVYPDCPYKSPLGSVLDTAARRISVVGRAFWHICVLYPVWSIVRPILYITNPMWLLSQPNFGRLRRYTPAQSRTNHVADFISKNKMRLQARAVAWMANSSNQIVQELALQFISRWNFPTHIRTEVSASITSAAARVVHGHVVSMGRDILRPDDRALENISLIAALTTMEYRSVSGPPLGGKITVWAHGQDDVPVELNMRLFLRERQFGMVALWYLLDARGARVRGTRNVLSRIRNATLRLKTTYIALERDLTWIHSTPLASYHLAEVLDYWTLILTQGPVTMLLLEKYGSLLGHWLEADGTRMSCCPDDSQLEWKQRYPQQSTSWEEPLVNCLTALFSPDRYVINDRPRRIR